MKNLASEKPGVARRKLLLVDDDRLVLATLAKGLRHAGFDIFEADSGERALALLESVVPDLVILDVSMPGVSGFEVAGHLRAKTRIPFIFLSAYSDDATVRAAVAGAAVGYLVKPVDIAQIVPSIEAGLARAADIAALERAEARLEAALAAGRETSVAIGILMERAGISQEQAFERLRARARRSRRAINELAKELVAAHELLSAFD